MAHYGRIEFWEDRYKKDKEPFDWYQKYGGIRDIITQYIKHDVNILNIGAGNSSKSYSF